MTEPPLHPWNRDLWERLQSQGERRSHAWLFCGAEGLGKNDLAARYLISVLGIDGAARALVAAGTHPDLHVLMPGALAGGDGLLERYALRYRDEPKSASAKPKRAIGIDQVRRLIDTIYRSPHMSRYKGVLITPADRLNLNAANALLKSLEEPPENTVFVLTTNRPEHLPATIRSRCVRLDFRIPDPVQALNWLTGRVSDPDRARVLLQLAAGAPLRAIAMEQSQYPESRDALLSDIDDLFAQADPYAVAHRWQDREILLLEQLQTVLADLIRCRQARQPAHLYHEDRRAWLQEAAKRIHLKRSFALWDRLGITLADREGPLDLGLVVETTLIDLLRATQATHTI